MSRVSMITTAIAVASAAAHAATVYDDSAEFVSVLDAGYYLNDFSNLQAWAVHSVDGSYNGFSYTITASEGSSPSHGDGFFSLDHALRSIVITFTGDPVNAIGGNMWATDINLNAIPSTVSVELSDGTMLSFDTDSETDFRGFTSNYAITTMTISSIPTNGDDYSWASLDNLIVGTSGTIAVVPLPTAAWAGLSLMGVMGGVRAIRRRA